MRPPRDNADPPQPHQRKKPLYRRRWIWITAAVLAAFWVCVGPWPVHTGGYEDTNYAEATFSRLDAINWQPTRGPLRAGAAKLDITPPVGVPLAGYGGRKPKESVGVRDRIFARAVSFSNGQSTVTILGGDILLVTPNLREAVLERLDVPAEEVYFTATHTHSGPGGYSQSFLYELVLGDYDESVAEQLAEGFAEAVRLSRTEMTDATLRFARASARGASAGRYVRNRLDNSPGYAAAAALVAQDSEGAPIGSVVVFPAHATCLDDESHVLSGDYPGVMQSTLEDQAGGVVLFAAGAVGSMAPVERKPRGEELMQSATEDALAMLRPLVIADVEAPGKLEISRHGPRRETEIISRRLRVDLPVQQYRISRRWRLSPLAAGYLHGRRTELHAVRIGPVVLLGMPCDYSGELAADLDAQAGDVPLTPVVTSFNGDYVGYLLPRRRYWENHYESMDMNLFGPACGEYFNALSLRAMRLMGDYAGK
ncbi:MAG: neutral/alkaline non-lysosomal ceramidase N-terminal domain-containing protein [Phycisphaerae bacterium]